MLAIRMNVLLDSGFHRNDEVSGKTPNFNILLVSKRWIQRLGRAAKNPLLVLLR